MADDDLGTVIRRERERRQLTQQELATKLGVSGRTIGNWERGEAVPRSRLGALADVLGIHVMIDGHRRVVIVPANALGETRRRAGRESDDDLDRLEGFLSTEYPGLSSAQRARVVADVREMLETAALRRMIRHQSNG